MKPYKRIKFLRKWLAREITRQEIRLKMEKRELQRLRSRNIIMKEPIPFRVIQVIDYKTLYDSNSKVFKSITEEEFERALAEAAVADDSINQAMGKKLQNFLDNSIDKELKELNAKLFIKH